MKSATVKVTWPEKFSHPVDRQLSRIDNVEPRVIRYANPCPDNHYIQTVEFGGDLDQTREVLSTCESVVEYIVTDDRDHKVAYMKCRNVGFAKDFVCFHHRFDITVDWPIYYIDNKGGFKMQVAGELEGLQNATAALPDFMSIDIQRLGEYNPDKDEMMMSLTDNQRKLLATAHREGYYKVPRETTQAELAEELDISPGTISERLQRIEAKLAGGYLKQCQS